MSIPLPIFQKVFFKKYQKVTGELPRGNIVRAVLLACLSTESRTKRSCGTSRLTEFILSEAKGSLEEYRSYPR